MADNQHLTRGAVGSFACSPEFTLGTPSISFAPKNPHTYSGSFPTESHFFWDFPFQASFSPQSH